VRCLGPLLWLGECLPLLPILLLITDIVALTASNAARWQLDADIVVTLGNASDSISGRAAEQRDVAPFHCSMAPVLPTERIAHLSRA
jgi:hypothetical protein